MESGNARTDEHQLLMEVGTGYCSYAYWHPPTQTIDRLHFMLYEEADLEKDLLEVIDGVSQNTFSAVTLCAAFPQALLTPAKFFSNNYSALDIVYGQPAQSYRHDAIPEWQMVNMYSLPQKLVYILEHAFSDVRFLHTYTAAIKINSGYVADHQLSVHFTPRQFRVLLKKDAAIQLAQTYTYQTPLDVVYYLLKICYEFELEQAGVHLILSGLVEKESALFKELYQYFINVHFAHPPRIKLPEGSYPHHFFTSLYHLALCVL